MQEIREGIVPVKGLCVQPKYSPVFESEEADKIARAQRLCQECPVRNDCRKNLERSALMEGQIMVLGGRAVRVSVVPVSEHREGVVPEADDVVAALRERFGYRGEIPTVTLTDFKRKIARGDAAEVEERFGGALLLAEKLHEEPSRMFTSNLIAASADQTLINLQTAAPPLAGEQIQPNDEAQEQLRLVRAAVRQLGRQHPAGRGIMHARLLEYAIRSGTSALPCSLQELRRGAEFAAKYVRYINSNYRHLLGTVEHLADRQEDLARLAMAFIADVAAFKEAGISQPEVAARRFPAAILKELPRRFPRASLEEVHAALLKTDPYDFLQRRFPAQAIILSFPPKTEQES